MIAKIRVLGFRNGVTKAEALDGQHVYLNGRAGTIGERAEVQSQYVHDRLSPGWSKLKTKFHN